MVMDLINNGDGSQWRWWRILTTTVMDLDGDDVESQ
ncbi:uncharacterized protein G2W53_025368 [Senna tora]|uniref:Uncharacterized protein n=1 Tax=Senna tora TaxID=362788 RepID=A0A834TCY9_9FABA|nr:uncharacterized protein G2W53_025368 [Senna tora]